MARTFVIIMTMCKVVLELIVLIQYWRSKYAHFNVQVQSAPPHEAHNVQVQSTPPHETLMYKFKAHYCTATWSCIYKFKAHRYMELYVQVQSAPLHGTVCTSSKRTSTWNCMYKFKAHRYMELYVQVHYMELYTSLTTVSKCTSSSKCTTTRSMLKGIERM